MAAAAGESGIGEALARLAETVGRLVTQHLDLARSELEAEARRLATQAHTTGVRVGKIVAVALLAGVALTSAAALWVAALAQGWLGAAAPGFGFAVVGLGLAAAAAWLARTPAAANGATALATGERTTTTGSAAAARSAQRFAG